MAAVVPTLVMEGADTNLSVTYPVTGGTEKPLRKVYVEVTSTATSNTLNLATYCNSVSGILGVDFNSVDGAASTTYPTWSSTTLTLAQHAGSGGCKFVVTVY